MAEKMKCTVKLKQVTDDDVGKTYLQYSTEITAGGHTEGLLKTVQQDQAGV